MRKILLEEIKNDNVLKERKYLQELVCSVIERIIKQIDMNMEYFQDKFPYCATKDNVYPIIENIEWTDGFYTGMLALVYEYTKDEKYLNMVNRHVESFYNRIANK